MHTHIHTHTNIYTQHTYTHAYICIPVIWLTWLTGPLPPLTRCVVRLVCCRGWINFTLQNAGPFFLPSLIPSLSSFLRLPSPSFLNLPSFLHFPAFLPSCLLAFLTSFLLSCFPAFHPFCLPYFLLSFLHSPIVLLDAVFDWRTKVSGSSSCCCAPLPAQWKMVRSTLPKPSKSSRACILR
jgi:hypothetical protein